LNRVVFSRTAERDIAALDPVQIRRLEKAIRLFMTNERHPSLNFEALKGQRGVFSIRMDQKWRILLNRAGDGVWEILRVAPHDIYRTVR